MSDIKTAVYVIGGGLEFFGVAAIALGALYATMVSIMLWLKRIAREEIYPGYRRQLGRGILLGLEFLVAADIINTVAIEPTFRTVGVLTVIVLIRTFLSFTLDVEMTGRWPWQRGPGERKEKSRERRNEL